MMAQMIILFEIPKPDGTLMWSVFWWCALLIVITVIISSNKPKDK
jgi:hypothetical protein